MSEHCETCKGRDYNVCRCGTHFLTAVRDHGGLCHDCRAGSESTRRWSECPNCDYAHTTDTDLGVLCGFDDTRVPSCDWPGCVLPASALVANDAPLTSSEYAERYACRWHHRNSTFSRDDTPDGTP